MIGLGTLANTAAIVVGGLIGLACGKRLTERYQKTIVSGLALSVMFVGIAGTLQEMLRANAGGRLVSQGSLMLVISLAIGAVLGEWWDLEGRFDRFGAWLRRVSHNERDNSFVHAFVTATLTFCIGAMAIVGSIEDGVKGDASILYLKSVMDGTLTIVLVASFGKGAIFSALPILLYQGAITLVAAGFASSVSPDAMSNVSYVGNLLIFAIGWNLIHGEKKIRVANLLPALVIAALWSLSSVRDASASRCSSTHTAAGTTKGHPYQEITHNGCSVVRLSAEPLARPDWRVTIEQDGKPIRLSADRQNVSEAASADGMRRFTCEQLTDGLRSWDVKVVVEARSDADGVSYNGRIVNSAKGVRVTGFEGPYFGGVSVDANNAALYFAHGTGRRVAGFPVAGQKCAPVPADTGYYDCWTAPTWYSLPDGRFTLDTGFYPGVSLTMPWTALDTGRGTLYVGAHDPKAQPKRLRVRWTPGARRAEVAVDHRLFLEAGGTWVIPESVCEKVDGDWHAAARRYRKWYDGVRSVRAATPAWTQSVVGWLLVIMRQQNEQVFWKYTDIPLLCDVAEKNGLDCIGLFGWTKGGHDHLYPDYDPSDEMGGVAALKAGIAEAHRRGIRVFIYANGQLQQVGATKFWEQYGKNLALIRRDGSRVIQTYHKYSDIPEYPFALGCLYGKPWHDRMQTLADQAVGFGADGILYDQLGIFAPFACYGKGHGHSTPHFSYAEERPQFVRSIADAVQKNHPDFAILTEGLHDTILDSIGLFHGCENGIFKEDAFALRERRSRGSANFPELWRYTFPELATTMRIPTPMVDRSVVNMAATFGLRHDIEVRYAPDRTYVVTGKVPTKADYGTVINLPDLASMASVPSAQASAYLKSVCDFQRAEAKYLLKGRFADDEGFICQASVPVVAKRYVAADGTSAVIVWNVSNRPAEVKIEGLGKPVRIAAPGKKATTGTIAADSLLLYVFAR